MKKLIALIATKGKTSKQISREVMEKYQKWMNKNKSQKKVS